MNFMPKRKRTFYDESALFSDPDSARQGERLERREGILRSGDSEQLWNVPTFPVNFREFRAPEVCLAAILDCRNIHGIRWVLQEMFSTAHLLQKEFVENRRDADAWNSTQRTAEVCYLGIALRKIPRTILLSVLESQLQDRSVRVVDQ